MSPRLGIIADDVTGALMVASYLEETGIRCSVFLDRPDAEALAETSVSVIATRMRLAPSHEALAELAALAEALDAAGCAQIAYKACSSFDSTEEGNIGPVADFLAERYDERPLLMNAGFPEFGTTVFNGYLFYKNRLVTDSVKRHDPVTPMPDPDLVRFLQTQSRGQVALLPHRVLREGEEAAHTALEWLVTEGARHVLTDCADMDDVETTVRLALDRRAVVGSDSVLIALARRVARPAAAGGGTAWPAIEAGPTAVLAGSVGPVALSQLNRFAVEHEVLELDPAAGETAEVSRALAWARPRLQSGALAVTTAMDETGVTRCQTALGQFEAARQAERILARVAEGLHGMGVRRFVVAGGETSGALVAGLGLRRVRALPLEALGAGVCVTEKAEPMALFLKSGKLGSEDILVRAAAELAVISAGAPGG